MPTSEIDKIKTAPEEDDVAFLNQLIAEFETPLLGEQESHEERKTLTERLKIRKEAPRKADLYEVDRLTLEMASDEEVIAQAPGLYRKYCLGRGEAIDPKDLALNPPHPGGGDAMRAFRAHMLEILRGLHWSYTFGPIREKSRVKLITDAMLVMVAASIIMGVLVGISSMLELPFFSMLVTVVYAGVMGGAVSCARRLGSVSTMDDALGSIYVLKNSRYVLLFAPITGAVFAVITMLLFMGKLLTGNLFPAFAELVTSGPVKGPWAFTSSLLPSSSKEYALLFLWCFIAGFAERFIPDALDGLTKRAAGQKSEGGKEAAPASH